jgi:hypothetical protein
MSSPKQFIAPTTYFLQEGRENLRECLKVAFQAARVQNVSKLVVFTARGEGVRIALEEFCFLDENKHVRLVATTFPAGKVFTDPSGNPISVGIDDANIALFKAREVPIIKAHMPFDPITPLYKQRGVLGQDLSLIGEALNIFGGSMSLCVQAIVMACDAGEIALGEHVIALSSDTAILAQATSTTRMLSELVIREILCKPAVFSIGRKEIAERFPVQMTLNIKAEPSSLGSGDIPNLHAASAEQVDPGSVKE